MPAIGWRDGVGSSIDGPPGWSVEISEFVFESGPVISRVKGRAIVTAEGPPDLMSTTGYLDIRSGERSAIYSER